MAVQDNALIVMYPYADLTTPEGRDAFRKMNAADAARGSRGGWEAVRARNNLLREAMRPAWEAEFRRVAFMATNTRDLRESYGPTPTIGYGEIIVPEPAGPVTLDGVIADVMNRFHAPAGVGDGFGGEDVAVWLDSRLRAVVRRGADGTPEVTRFDACDATAGAS